MITRIFTLFVTCFVFIFFTATPALANTEQLRFVFQPSNRPIPYAITAQLYDPSSSSAPFFVSSSASSKKNNRILRSSVTQIYPSKGPDDDNARGSKSEQAHHDNDTGTDHSNSTITGLSSAQPSSQENVHMYKINGMPGRQYEVRVCWPASIPLDFQLEYEVEVGVVKVTYFAEYYSHLKGLKDSPVPVGARYEVVLSPLVGFGALPSDIVATILQVVAGGLGAFFISGFVLHYV